MSRPTLLPATIAAIPPVALIVRLLDDVHAFAQLARQVTPHIGEGISLLREVVHHLDTGLPLIVQLNDHLEGALPEINTLNGHLSDAVPLLMRFDPVLNGFGVFTPIDGAFDRIGQMVNLIPGRRKDAPSA
ncbi:hypothetical protein [Hoyosella subflava]|uniref:Uncharacterized protein n=1 Tax=Hoyosella subflava (strain DSM 45089 / JCM 17490 / NBRC 109087 / DQS3-9A1) TaxID=443218 RepID=F6EI47_HOYSD|nr:hypothetical protein [Hoyosella subflava]AEF41154.1 hypothetical protein AS9A_2707 [Hoyosella subflava DQS3-9A1]